MPANSPARNLAICIERPEHVLLENMSVERGWIPMAFRLKAVLFLTAFSSFASFLADWHWGP